MDTTKLNLTTLHNVTIKQVVVGNKKLTKSVFSQIENVPCFNENIDFIGDNVIGYIKDKNDKFLLWVKNNKLRKTSLTSYYKLTPYIESSFIEDIEWFLKKTGLNYEMNSIHYRNKASENIDDKERYINLVRKVRAFLNELIDKQIFL